MKEKRQIFDSNCKPTGKYYFAGEPLPEDCYAMVVMIAIENSHGEFLMQKRSPLKSSPLTWAVTGGHPCYNESNLQGIIREVKEEIGLDIENENIISFFLGIDGKPCREMYYCKKDVDIDKLVLQPEEVEAVAWLSKDKILDMIKSNSLPQNQISFFNKLFMWKENNKV